MRRLGSVILLAVVLLSIAPVARGEEAMQKLYLLPIEMNGNRRGPKYFKWVFDPDPPGIDCGGFGMMDYGFTNNALLLAQNMTQADHDALILNSDVFSFPDDLDGPVDQDIQAFFEAIHLPTDWLTPSTTWRELLRQVAGMMQFNQRYGGIAANETGETYSIFDTATLDTRLNQMTSQEQGWFLAAVESFGYDPDLVPLNARLRQLVKSAGDFWAGRSFFLGGMEF